MDVSETITPRSDQLNAQDFAHTGPRTFTIVGVKDGAAEQPIDVVLAETDRYYRPSKSMRRVLVALHGQESEDWHGKRITLYCDPEVTFGREKVGGIKISHASGITKPLEVVLTATRGKATLHRVEPLAEQPKPDPVQQAVDWFASKGVDLAALEAHVDKPRAEWGPAELEELRRDSEALIGGEPT